jgi:hypothetical protein
MHRHDFDLIAALADGSLEDESRARALVDECETCRGEYESQRTMLEALKALPAASMSDDERSRLHRDVLTAMTEQPRADVAAEKRSPWLRWAYAVAGVFIVAGVVGAITQLGAFNAGDTAGFGGDLEGPTQGLGEVDGGGRSVTTTTSGATGEEATPPDDSSGGTVPWQPLVDRAHELANPNYIAEFADNATAEDALACIEEAGLDKSEYRLVGTVNPSTAYLLAVPSGTDFDRSTPITVIDFETCDVLAVDG